MSAAATQPDAGRTAGVNANAVLAIVAVAQFMVILDASIVNVALPTIKRDVGFSEQSLSWILNAYTLIFGGSLISTGGFVLLTTVSGHGDYASHVVPAMIILGVGMGMSFVPVTIAGTSGVAPGDSGSASGLLNTTQQVGGSLGLAILTSVATSRTTSALHTGLALPAALTHGFTGAFIVGAVLCAMGALFTIVLLPGRQREPADEDVQTIALSFTRCPGAPYCGYLARAVGFGRRVRTRLARS